jgi:hypothetical protein
MRLLRNVLLSLVLSGIAFAQAQPDPITREAQRLAGLLKHVNNDDPDWKDTKPLIATYLEQSQANAAAGRQYRALELLAEAEGIFIATNTMALAKQQGKLDIPKFETAWRETGKELTAFDERAKQQDWKGIPAAVRAIAESNQGKTMTLLNASRAYASVTAPEYGFYYLGQAQAAAGVAQFATRLPLRSQVAPAPLRSVLPELQKLQNEVLAAFQPPRSIDKHPEFIRLNATLKLANELDQAKLYAGALYQYLAASELFAVMEAAEPDNGKQEGLKSRIAKLKAEVGANRDDSIAQIFLQRADGFIATPAQNTWKRTAAIADTVLPAYRAYLSAAPSLASTAGRTINVTLVRWPYT